MKKTAVKNFNDESALKSLLLPQRLKISKPHNEYIIMNQHFLKLSVLVY
jgi:hypothetical protein